MASGIFTVISIIIIYIFSCLIHEMFHVLTIRFFGDKTPSINPLKYIQKSGFVSVPNKLINKEKLLVVHIAGIFSNFLLLFFFFFLYYITNIKIFLYFTIINILIIVINIIPIKNTDGYKIIKWFIERRD